MPAEWETHDATWISWPHHEPDWPGKLEPIPWVYAEIVRVLHENERVEILVHDEEVASHAQRCLDAHEVAPDGYRLHLVPTDRVWLRDSGPTMVRTAAGAIELINWQFNGWAKYENHVLDSRVGAAVEALTGLPRHSPRWPDSNARVVLEGGAIDTDGLGTLLTTEECLLSAVQERNRGMQQADYEELFAKWLGIAHTIWLGEGCVGDDTHGHVDDIARFVAPGVVALAYEEDPTDENHERSLDNMRRLELARDARGNQLQIVQIPYPRAVTMDEVRLPASYLNFYIANRTVLVPTFNDVNDRIALNNLVECFPEHRVVGIHAVDLVWGLGTLHCLSQQQPRP